MFDGPPGDAVKVLSNFRQIAAATEAGVDEGERHHPVSLAFMLRIPRAFQFKVEFIQIERKVPPHSLQQGIAQRETPRVPVLWLLRGRHGDQEPQDFDLSRCRDREWSR